MPSAITGVTQPVQLHAKCLQIETCRGVLRMTAQQADGGEAEAFARCGQGMQMIGMRTAQADHAFSTGLGCRRQMMSQLEPLVAGDQRVDQVQTKDSHLDTGLF